LLSSFYRIPAPQIFEYENFKISLKYALKRVLIGKVTELASALAASDSK